MIRFRAEYGGPGVLAVAGGVAANQSIRAALAQEAAAADCLQRCTAALCGDNAAMIAWAALEQLEAGGGAAARHARRPRWPLDPEAAAPLALCGRDRLGRPNRIALLTLLALAVSPSLRLQRFRRCRGL